MERTSGLGASPQIEAISDEIRRSHHGDPWHGPAVAGVLEGVTAAEAATRAVIGAHTIWELVLHLAAWRGEVARRIETGKHGEPPEGDWPEVPRPTTTEANEADWAAARERLAAAEVALQKALLAFPAERLGETFGGDRDAPLGSGVTWGVMLHGVAQHDAYHAGQIMILRKALAAAGPPAGTA
jgi:uncharacterized damage-inducible protein DinB